MIMTEQEYSIVTHLSTRFDIAVQMLDPSRPWGLVTQLAEEYQVSRKFLYQQRDKAGATLPGCSLRWSKGNPRWHGTG